MREFMQTVVHFDEAAKMMNALQNQFVGQDWALHGCNTIMVRATDYSEPESRILIIHSRRAPQ